jgi:hypothetical protein
MLYTTDKRLMSLVEGGAPDEAVVDYLQDEGHGLPEALWLFAGTAELAHADGITPAQFLLWLKKVMPGFRLRQDPGGLLNETTAPAYLIESLAWKDDDDWALDIAACAARQSPTEPRHLVECAPFDYALGPMRPRCRYCANLLDGVGMSGGFDYVPLYAEGLCRPCAAYYLSPERSFRLRRLKRRVLSQFGPERFTVEAGSPVASIYRHALRTEADGRLLPFPPEQLTVTPLGGGRHLYSASAPPACLVESEATLAGRWAALTR